MSLQAAHLWVLLHGGVQDGGLGRGSRDGDSPPLSNRSTPILTEQPFT